MILFLAASSFAMACLLYMSLRAMDAKDRKLSALLDEINLINAHCKNAHEEAGFLRRKLARREDEIECRNKQLSFETTQQSQLQKKYDATVEMRNNQKKRMQTEIDYLNESLSVVLTRANIRGQVIANIYAALADGVEGDPGAVVLTELENEYVDDEEKRKTPGCDRRAKEAAEDYAKKMDATVRIFPEVEDLSEAE